MGDLEFPTLFQYETWAGADLMIKGLQMAGPNPSRAAVIEELRSIKDYTANGSLPNPIDYATIIGHDPPRQCVWVLRAEKHGFVPYSSHTVCGTDLQGTASGGSSREGPALGRSRWPKTSISRPEQGDSFRRW